MAERTADRAPGTWGRIAGIEGWLFGSSMVVLALAAIGITLAALAVLSGGRAYVHGEGRYAKAQQEAVFHLDRYAEKGLHPDLEEARSALEVPLGDYHARRAMQDPELDYDAAYEGLRQGQNAPADIPTMIWLFRYFHDAPYAAEAVETWEVADKRILELVSIADELENRWADPPVDEAAIASIRDRIAAIDRILRSLETRFSQTINNGLYHLRNFIAATLTVAIAILAAITIMVYRWTTRRIRRSERRFWATFEHAPVGVAVISPQGHYLEVNEVWARILGQSRESLHGASINHFTHPDDTGNATDLLARVCAADRDRITVERRYGEDTGHTVWTKLTLAKASGTFEAEGAVIGILEDVSEARKLSEELSWQATHDPLTGQFNRRRFETELERMVEDVRVRDSCHALGFVDLDQFKIINDTCGHQAGDALLNQIADVMRKALRSSDVFARLGGDEFGFILRDCDVDAMKRVAETLRHEVEAFTFVWNGHSFSLSCSIGVVMLDKTVTDANMVLQLADTACYVAKEEGRNRIQLHTEDEGTRTSGAIDGMEWVNAIRQAIAANRLELWAQRIEALDAPDGLRYEILVRLRDADGELHLPAAFLPPAERFHMAVAVDRWVIERLWTRFQSHPAHAASLSACHINISGQSLVDGGFTKRLHEFIADNPVPPGKLCFEVTENAAIANLPSATDFLQQLRARGCCIALDDFGRGLSSYGYLKSLPIDLLKIDGQFVRSMAEDRFDRTMVESIAHMAHLMEIRTIAEFVEDEATLEHVRAMGIDFAQGQGVENPQPLDELLITGGHEPGSNSTAGGAPPVH